MCLSVFPHDISKTDAARIMKLDTGPPRDLQIHLFWGQKVKVTRYKTIAGVNGHGALVSFSLCRTSDFEFFSLTIVMHLYTFCNGCTINAQMMMMLASIIIKQITIGLLRIVPCR